MKRGLLGVLLLGSAALACSDLRDAPLNPESPATLGTTTTTEVAASVGVLQRSSPLGKDVSVTADIGKLGGTMEIPEAGIKVIFPANAVTPSGRHKSVRITLTALKGSNVAYVFQPHGITFREPVTVHQDAKATDAWKNPALLGSRGAYFSSTTALSGTRAAVSEFRPTEYELTGSKFRWTIDHFSGYLLSVP